MSDNVSVDELNKRLAKDEEWLREFEANLSKSSQIAENVSTVLDNFTQQIRALETRLSPLCTKTSVIQKKQQNVKKLLGITEASIQFYGKSVEFESAIRRGTSNLGLEEYIEVMNGLKDAIDFFGSHPGYKGQLDAMKESFANGCSFLETEFNNYVRNESNVLEPLKFGECLDENYEIPFSKFQSLSTMKDTTKCGVIGRYLHKNTSCIQYLKYFVNYRSENMLKIIRLVNDQARGVVQQKSSRSQFIKSALKKAAGKSKEQFDDPWGESTIMVSTILLSVLLVLIQLETDVCSKIFASVDIEAQLVRKIASEPMKECIQRGINAVDQFDANFVSMLPLARFMTHHSNQLRSLSENVGHGELYGTFCRKVYAKSVQLISDFVDHLTNEHTRFVPSDGNVHEITSNTMNFMKILAKYQNVVTHILESSQKSSSLNLSSLFAQILAALGVNLKNKSTAYAEPHLAVLFMLNNLSYVNQCLREDSIGKLIKEQNNQFFAFNEREISSYTKKYLQRFGWCDNDKVFSWDRVIAVLNNDGNAKTRYANFNREFDSLIESQKQYCVANVDMARSIRSQIKKMILGPYVEFTTQHSQEVQDFNLDRQLKYDVESIEIIIDRLFAVAY